MLKVCVKTFATPLHRMHIKAGIFSEKFVCLKRASKTNDQFFRFDVLKIAKTSKR